MILADIGNSRMHIYDGKEVIHLDHQKGIEQYAHQDLCYITVNHQLKSDLSQLQRWRDISSLIHLPNEYETMGIDRKALCLSHPNGIFVSAGSAITVDLVADGIYQGGFLLPGIRSYLKAFGDISPALLVELDRRINIEHLPRSTQEGISYGIVGSIKALIEKHREDKRLYISGGDGAFLSSFFEGAVFDERLIFQGMKRILEGMSDH
jgi:type III pantothenate kinase